MKRIKYIAAVVLMSGVFAGAGDIKVKYTGPSGQGNQITYSGITGATNMVITTSGAVNITTLNAANVISTPTLTVTGTATNGTTSTLGTTTTANLTVNTNAVVTGTTLMTGIATFTAAPNFNAARGAAGAVAASMTNGVTSMTATATWIPVTIGGTNYWMPTFLKN